MTGLHPVMAAAVTPFIPARDVYRDWLISFDYPPIPVRDFDWSATSADYDASYEGPEDGWVVSGDIVHASSRAGIVEAIDAWYAENGETA